MSHSGGFLAPEQKDVSFMLFTTSHGRDKSFFRFLFGMKRKGRGGFFIIIGSVDFIAAGQSSIFGHFSAALAVFKNKEVQCNYLSVNQDRENFLCTKKRREWNIKKYQKWTLFTTVNRKKPWAGLAQNSCKRFAVFGTLFRA